MLIFSNVLFVCFCFDEEMEMMEGKGKRLCFGNRPNMDRSVSFRFDFDR